MRPTCLLQADRNGKRVWLAFRSFSGELRAETIDEVLPVLETVGDATAGGLWAAGFLTYEAAGAVDAALTTRLAGSLPLAWFGLFESVEPLATLPTPAGRFSLTDWLPSIDEQEYHTRIQRIRDLIARGDTYQLNMTLRLRSEFSGDPMALMHRLASTNRAPRHCAFVDIGTHAICSASPELFFSLRNGHITMRPMKGTAKRGRTPSEDRRQAEWLHASPKNRAENVMIVDMVRNDVGQVAVPGSVSTRSLFDIERYDTLWQMTSTVEARTDAPTSAVLAALFPSASITGAPKARTMEAIAELEDSPRGIYTGAIGYCGPSREAQFNVAIRTVHIDRDTGVAEYGTGGGIVWDSTAADEYKECRTKALAVTAPRPEFSLLETMRLTPQEGYFLLRRHLDRLVESAAYFAFACDESAILSALEELTAGFPTEPQRVRLLLDASGLVALDHRALDDQPKNWRVALATSPVDADDVFLFHKTTNRGAYEDAQKSLPALDDVLLWNQNGEITESTLANVAVLTEGKWWTPPISSGLLAGTFRGELLKQGLLAARPIYSEELTDAEGLCLINSVRGWIPATLVSLSADQRGTGAEQPQHQQNRQTEDNQEDE